MRLNQLPQRVVDVVLDEAQFLEPYESNWSGAFGLPGRREAHLVAALANNFRDGFRRPVLDDSFWGCPDTRCDLVFQPSKTVPWTWLEVKTMPVEDANDKLASVHGDLAKLDRAAACDPRNLPQALVVVGYDYEGGALAERLRRLATAHHLGAWPIRLGKDGVQVVPIPGRPYTHAVIGVWARRELGAVAHTCDGRCHLVRQASAAP